MEDLPNNGQFPSNETEDKVVWLEPQTKFLLALVQEHLKVGKSLKFKTKKKMWEVVAQTMKEKGYSYNSAQIENKWKVWKGVIKKNYDNKKTGHDRVSCAYEKYY